MGGPPGLSWHTLRGSSHNHADLDVRVVVYASIGTCDEFRNLSDALANAKTWTGQSRHGQQTNSRQCDALQ